MIERGVEESFTVVARDLARAGLEDAPAAGVVVTGGTAIMDGLPELAGQVFDLPVRRGTPEGVGGLDDVGQSPIFATAVGLALYGIRTGGGAFDAADGRGGARMWGWV